MDDVPRRGNHEGTVGIHPSGLYQARVMIDGVRRSYYGRTRTAAVDKMKNAKKRHPSVARTTVASYLARYLDDVAAVTVRPSTLRSYRMIATYHVARSSLGRMLIWKLTVGDVQRYLNAKRETLSASTVGHHRAFLRVALNHALAEGYIERNAAALAKPPRAERREIVPLTPEQARAFLAAVRGDRLEALYLTALTTGLRQGELLGLTWPDIDTTGRSLTVRVALQRVGGRLELVEPKTERSRRTVALTPGTASALDAHKRRQATELMTIPAKDRYGDRDFVFAHPDGYPLEGYAVTKAFQRHLQAAGLPHQRFHDLRHAAATFMLAEGVPLRVVMETLGHSTITITANTYGHVAAEVQRAAAEGIERAIGGDR